MIISIELWRPWSFLILCMLLFATLIFLLIKRSGKGATVALLGAVVCAFFSDADSFELFKFSAQNGIEARVRSVVTEAQTATEGLRNVAVAASSAIISMSGLVSNGGMAMTQPAKVRDQNKDQLISILKSMGVPESQLTMVNLADRDNVIRQYEFSIFVLAGNVVGKSGTQADRNNLAAMEVGDGFGSPERIADFLAKLDYRDSTLDELGKDLAFYMDKGTQRRPEVWADRDNWPSGSP